MSELRDALLTRLSEAYTAYFDVEPVQDGSPLKRGTYVLYHSSYHELQQVRLFLDTLVESERLHPHL